MDVYNYRGRAQELVSSLPGLVVTVSEAVRALRRYGGSFARARQFIERNASRNPVSGRIYSRAEQKLIPFQETELPMKRQRINRVNEHVPATDKLSGAVVAVGDHVILSRSKKTKRVFSKNGKVQSALSLFMNKGIQRNIYRWQSIRSYTNSSETSDIRSLYLDTRPYITNGNVGQLWLPMYAFDLTTLPFNGYHIGTKYGNRFESCPMYRLKKTTESSTGLASGPAYSLNPNVHNYTWELQNGMNNGPTVEFIDKSNPLWNPESVVTNGSNAHAYRNNWNSVDLLFSCTRTEQCKIHVSLVRFKKFAGPRRHYCNQQVFSQTGVPTVVSDDPIDTHNRTDRDVFWESFWDSKVVHPLCQYVNPTKEKYIDIISDEVIHVLPEDSTENRPFHHLKQLFIRDGATFNLRSEVTEDMVSGYNPNTEFASFAQPPVCSDATTAGTAEFKYGSCFNICNRRTDTGKLYIADQDGNENNTWLLIWMEQMLPNENQQAYSTNEPRQPETLPVLDRQCSFDIKVRRCVDIYADDEAIF